MQSLRHKHQDLGSRAWRACSFRAQWSNLVRDPTTAASKREVLRVADLQVHPDDSESISDISRDQCVMAHAAALRERGNRVASIREIKKEKAAVRARPAFRNQRVFTFAPNLNDVPGKHTRSVSRDPSNCDLTAKNFKVTHCAAWTSIMPSLICFSVTSVTGSAANTGILRVTV